MCSMLLVARETAKLTTGESITESMEEDSQERTEEEPDSREDAVIVLDAGHGGEDPGKVGINGCLEKDINLEITLLVRDKLAEEGVQAVLTREKDEGLHGKNASNKKVEDLKKRLEIMEAEKPKLVVSIHQNSYPEEYVKGAQVFYYGTSEEGKKAAEIMQNILIEKVDPSNHREAKSNESYYLLKKTSAVIIIVECGFLSNYQEAELLKTADYQEKVAKAICQGIIEYLDEAE